MCSEIRGKTCENGKDHLDWHRRLPQEVRRHVRTAWICEGGIQVCPKEPEGVWGWNRYVRLAETCAQTSQKTCEDGIDM